MTTQSETDATAPGVGEIRSTLPNLTSEKIRIQEAGGIVAIVIDDQPARNALTVNMADDLASALAWASGSSRAIILRGEGMHFCAGANRRGGSGMGDDSADAAQILQDHYHPVIQAIAGAEVPVITAVRGAAAGFGASLAMAGDVVLMSDDAFFAQAFRSMGLVPDGGFAYFLERAVGRIRANAIMLLGDRVSAAEALDWGLVTKIVPVLDFDAELDRIATSLATGPTVALGLTRRMTWQAAEQNLAEVLKAEMQDQCVAARSSDHRRAIDALADRCTPVFLGR